MLFREVYIMGETIKKRVNYKSQNSGDLTASGEGD